MAKRRLEEIPVTVTFLEMNAPPALFAAAADTTGRSR